LPSSTFAREFSDGPGGHTLVDDPPAMTMTMAMTRSAQEDRAGADQTAAAVCR
jgi:hypothetical protein